MSTRGNQAFNDGRLAYREGKPCDGGSRKSPAQRTAWRRGYEHEQRLSQVERATPEQLAESRSVVSRLKEWASENLR